MYYFSLLTKSLCDRKKWLRGPYLGDPWYIWIYTDLVKNSRQNVTIFPTSLQHLLPTRLNSVPG